MYRIMKTGTEIIRIIAATKLNGVARDREYSDTLIPINSLSMNHTRKPRDEAGA
jgi:hypothetical protein